jgi:hypothetical protein
MNTYRKLELLKALKTVLKEYKDETHRTKKDKCSLCQLYIVSDYECDRCPMFLFGDSYEHMYPCMNRKCRPVDCEAIFPMWFKEDLEKVIEFYEAIIKKVASMTTKELNAEGAFKFLVDIDDKIDKNIKYKLI